MSRRIHRFNLGGGAVILHSEKGRYMLWDDHNEIVGKLNAEIAELTKQISRMRARDSYNSRTNWD